jgi:hypothetical protein
MCHERWLRRQERGEYGRGERMWDLFYRETRESPPPTPVAEREAEPEPEREEAMAGAPRRENDLH